MVAEVGPGGVVADFDGLDAGGPGAGKEDGRGGNGKMEIPKSKLGKRRAANEAIHPAEPAECGGGVVPGINSARFPYDRKSEEKSAQARVPVLRRRAGLKPGLYKSDAECAAPTALGNVFAW